MSKNTSFSGQPIFTQVLKLIPKDVVVKLTAQYQTNRYVKCFNTYEHLVSMLFCVFQRCTSLREVVTGMQAWENRLVHLGVKTYPKRSTLAEANQRRSSQFFEHLFHELVRIYSRNSLPDSRQSSNIDLRLLLIDSTTIELFSDIMGGAGSPSKDGKRKGGVKAHVQLNPIHNIPDIVYLTAAKENDRVFMSIIVAPKGSILVFDRGYFKYSQWQEWTDQGVFWVTRMRGDAVYQVLEDFTVNDKQKKLGVISDQKVLLGRGSFKGTEIIFARRIVYWDQDKKRQFEFVTNHDRFSPSNIAALYKKRWQIETTFKSIKQNYQLKYFLGDSENAIRIQIWCSLIADLLVKVIKKSVKKKTWALSNLCSMIRMHLATYIDMWEFLSSPEGALKKYRNYQAKQILLFEDS
jgi:Transposase DDE domain/Domain of unknown function (DUF4372)